MCIETCSDKVQKSIKELSKVQVSKLQSMKRGEHPGVDSAPRHIGAATLTMMNRFCDVLLMHIHFLNLDLAILPDTWLVMPLNIY